MSVVTKFIPSVRSLLYRRFSWLLQQRFSLTKRDGERLSSKEVGDLGERIACHYVNAIGGKVIYRNYRGPKGGELDIVARDGKFLCFIEVKTRTSKSEHSRPMDAVDFKKRQYIIRGAHAWLGLLKDDDHLWRYDVVEVILQDGEFPELVWVKQAFVENA